MKMNNWCMALMGLMMFCMVTLGACATPSNYNPVEFEEVTEQVEFQVPEQQIPNAQGGVDILPEHLELREVTYKVPRVKPVAQNIVAGVQKANSFLNPTPTAPLINLGLETFMAAVAGVFGIWAQVNKKKAVERERRMLHAVVDGVEEGGSPNVKKVIKTIAGRNGVGQELLRVVKSRTA